MARSDGKTMLNQTVHVTIPSDGTPIPLSELMYTLSYFRGQYFAVLNELQVLDIDLTQPPTLQECKVLAESISDTMYFNGLLEWNIIDLGTKDIAKGDSEFDLQVIDLKRNNPVELVLAGLATPLIIAVIISGGELTIGPLKVKLPPIGKGLKELRSALQPQTPAQIKLQKLPHASAPVEEKLKLPRLKS